MVLASKYGLQRIRLFLIDRLTTPASQARQASMKSMIFSNLGTGRRLRLAMGGMASCWHSRAFDEDPKDYADFDNYKTEIDTAAYLGSEAIAVHYIGKNLTTESFTPNNPEFVSMVLDYAAEKKVCITLETRHLDSLQRALDIFPRLGVCLDPACIRAHSHHNLADFMEATKDRICFLHLYDQRGDINHLTPGCGEIPIDEWRYMLNVLREIEFQGPAVLEIRPPPEKSNQSPIEAALEARAFFDSLE